MPGESSVRRSVRSPTAIAFAGLFAAALALRVYAVISYWPAAILPTTHDGAAYVRSASQRLSLNTQDPLGYPVFLRFLHTLSDQLAFTIGVQHALGLAAGALFFLTVRRAGGPPWLGLVPAAVVLFNADGLFLEHALLTESLFTFLLAGALYVAVRTQEGPGPPLIVLAGVLAALPLTLRTVGLPLVMVMLAGLAITWWRAGLPWLRNTALATGGALLVIGAYAALWHHSTGRWGLSPDGSGWSLYARAAAFADCREFTPPKGTAFLCETTPPSERPGGLYYGYHGGPAVARYGGPARGDALLARFARAAIVNQPLDYLDAVWIDVLHYVEADAGPVRELGYPGAPAVEFPSGVPPPDPESVREARAYYAPFRPTGGEPAHDLHRYQQVFRVSGGLLLALLIVGVIGVVAATGRVRWTIALLLAVGLELVLVPASVHTEWRFTVPADGPIAAAAALGGWAAVRRVAAWDRVRRWRAEPQAG
jgi:hypothetical protein